jgi:archaeal type IV pilus assembly protein PilA
MVFNKPKGGLKEKMIYRKFRKNAKALSPVVASIILIAVTVAVSVVVAAWMGGMTIGLMGSAEQMSITNVAFPDASNIQVLVQNAGGTQGTINSAFINGVATNVFTPVGVAKSSQTIITFTNGQNATIALTPGTSYTIKLISAKGTSIVSSAVTYSP